MIQRGRQWNYYTKQIQYNTLLAAVRDQSPIPGTGGIITIRGVR